MADQPVTPRCLCRYPMRWLGEPARPMTQEHCKHPPTQEDGFCDLCRKLHKGRHCNDEVRHG